MVHLRPRNLRMDHEKASAAIAGAFYIICLNMLCRKRDVSRTFFALSRKAFSDSDCLYFGFCAGCTGRKTACPFAFSTPRFFRRWKNLSPPTSSKYSHLPVFCPAKAGRTCRCAEPYGSLDPAYLAFAYRLIPPPLRGGCMIRLSCDLVSVNSLFSFPSVLMFNKRSVLASTLLYWFN